MVHCADVSSLVPLALAARSHGLTTSLRLLAVPRSCSSRLRTFTPSLTGTLARTGSECASSRANSVSFCVDPKKADPPSSLAQCFLQRSGHAATSDGPTTGAQAVHSGRVGSTCNTVMERVIHGGERVARALQMCLFRLSQLVVLDRFEPHLGVRSRLLLVCVTFQCVREL